MFSKKLILIIHSILYAAELYLIVFYLNLFLYLSDSFLTCSYVLLSKTNKLAGVLLFNTYEFLLYY